MERTLIRVKLAASQPFWMQIWVTEKEKRDAFLFGKLGVFTVAYIWPEGAHIMFDCEARQWLTVEGGHALNSAFETAARTMTAQDRYIVQKLVRTCLATSHDLGEDE